MMTPWFNKYTRPHWVGVYETRVNGNNNGLYFNYWNGNYWERSTLMAHRRYMDRLPCYVQHIEWRGFTKEQK
jgi:hypothetical protein